MLIFALGLKENNIKKSEKKKKKKKKKIFEKLYISKT